MKKLLIVMFLLACILVSCGASSIEGYYTSDGTYVVENGPVENESLDGEENDMTKRIRAYTGYDDFMQDAEKYYDDILVIRAKKLNSKSTYKEKSNGSYDVAYTDTEISIEDVYFQNGSLYENIKAGDTMKVFEFYSFEPQKGGNPKFIKISATQYFPENITLPVSQMCLTFHPEFLTEDKEYIMVFVLKESYMVSNTFYVGDTLIPDVYTTMFYPYIAFEFDESMYKTLSETVPKDVEKRDSPEAYELDYIEFDILDRFVYGKSES